MNDILPLSTVGKLPRPVLKRREDSASTEHTAQPKDEKPASPRLAAYQALPVSQSTIITHNITPALPVLEPDQLDKEVSGDGQPGTRMIGTAFKAAMQFVRYMAL
jgi:hypothetical protein